MQRTCQEGMTLIELVIVVLVLGVLGSIALPGFSAFMVRNKIGNDLSGLQGDLQFARNEAATRGQDVLVVALSGATWSSGWLVRDSGGNVLRMRQGLTSGNVISGDGSGTITFNRYGFTSTHKIKLCIPNNADRDAKAILIARTGRIRQAFDTGSDGVVDDGVVNFSCP